MASDSDQEISFIIIPDKVEGEHIDEVGGEHIDEVGGEHIDEVGGEHIPHEVDDEHIPDEVGGEHSLHDDFSQTTAQPTFINISSHNIHSQLEISLEQKGMSTDDETADGSYVMISSKASDPCHCPDNYNTENANLYISNKEISKETDVQVSDTKEKAIESTEDAIRHTGNKSNTIFGEKKYSVKNDGPVKSKLLHPQSAEFHSLDTSDHTHDMHADSTLQNEGSCGSLPDAPLSYEEPTSQPSLTSYLSRHVQHMPVHTSQTEMNEHGAFPVGFQRYVHPNQYQVWSNFQPSNNPQQIFAHHPGFTQSVSPQFPVQVHSPREPTQSQYQARGQALPNFDGHLQQWQYYYQPQPFRPETPPSFASPTSSGGTKFSSTSGLSQSPSRLPTKPGSVIPISSPPGQPSRSDIKARTLRVDGVNEKTEIKLLKMYFQSQQKSGGGVVSNVDDHRSQGYVLLTFEDPVVADRIIKRSHSFAQKKLTVRIHDDKPLVTTIVSQTEQFDEESRTVEVRGSDIVTDKEMMEIYFEDEESGGRDIQKIEVDEVLQMTYITFEDVNVAREVLKRKHTLEGATLKVTPCRPPTCIRVSGIKQHVTEDQLTKYFESKTFGGAKVKAVLLTENKGEAFVTFTDSSAIAKIMRHQHHQVGGNTISITTVRIAPRSPAGQNVTSTPENTKSRIVEVKGLQKDTPQSILKKYFENKGKSGGGKVKDMKCDLDAGKALITFQDDDAVNHVLEKKHVFRGTVIQVGIFTPPAEPQQSNEALQLNTVAVENLEPSITEEMLTNYFENKRRSGGGPVKEVKIDAKNRTAFVTFENPADAKNVTSRDHTLDKRKFKVVFRKPPEVMKDHVVLRGLPDCMSREQIINFVESLTDVDVQTVLYGEEDVVVVVFKTEIDISTVRTALTKGQMQYHTLSVEEVPVSSTILVKFEKNTKLSKDALTLYFESVRSGGGDVTEVIMGEKGEYALVTFEDTKVAASVAKRKHNLEDQEVYVFLWMECLGINGGSEEPVIKSVDPVGLSISDKRKISLLKKGCQVMLEDLGNELQKHHARLDWSDPERSVHLVCCLTPETPGARELAKTWAENITNILQNHLSTVKMEEVKVTREEYTEMAPLLQEEVGEARVGMTFDEEEGRVFIVWDRDEIVDIVRNLQSTISKVKEKFNRKKCEKCVHKEINKWKMLLLEKEKTDKKLKDKFPQLEVTYDFEECCMILKGVDEEIHEMESLAQTDINKIISRRHTWTSSLAKELLTFPETQRCLESICTVQDSECVLELTSNGFIVYSFNEEKVDEVLTTGQRALEEQVIPLSKETEEARRLPQWEELKSSIQERNRGLVLIRENESSLTIIGVNTTLNFEIQQLTEFLEENGSYQYYSQIDDLYSQMFLTFMRENLDTRRAQEVFRIDDILFHDDTTSIVVKGNKAGIQAAQDEKSHFYRTLVCKKKIFTQPCMKEFLKCADWRSKCSEIEQKLKCRILEPAECPQELASKAVVATTRRGELSQEDAAIVPAPEKAIHTTEHHMDTAKKSKKEIRRKSEQVKLTEPMKMRIFLHKMSDITKEEHDALVNSSNTSLNLEYGQVSKALVEVGGTKIQEDCKTKYPNGIKMGDIAVSCAGNLKLVKKLLHCCLPEEKDHEKIRNVVSEAVTKCLQKAEELELRSVGFPALGTGILNYPPDLVAKAMYQATIKYSLEHPDSKVSDAIFILHKKDSKDSAVRQAFDAEDKAFKELIGESSQSAVDAALRQVNPNAQGIKTYPHFENSRSDEILFFVANSSRVIEEAERELLECYHGKIKKMSFDVSHLDQWDDYHVTTVSNAGIAGNYDVTFNYVMGRLEFRGFEDTVRQIPVHLMIKNAEKHVQDKVQADLLAKQVQWSSVAVSETDEVLQPYSGINNYLIETAYRNGQASLVILCERINQPVNINFSQMEESPENPEVAKDVVPMRIIRHDLLQGMALDAPLPDHWTNMIGEIDVVSLSTGSRDYIRVAEVFRTSSDQPRLEIKRISRVQNKTLHKQYMAMRKQIVASLPPGKRCERDNMWHGTKEGSVDGIIHYGFNRSYSNCDANNFGQGVYFATEAEYSMRETYASKNSNGERHIFMCKVLVGEYTVGKPEMRFPPEIPGSNGKRYNSVVDDKEKPSTFVIFNDVQAYPEYFIIFK